MTTEKRETPETVLREKRRLLSQKHTKCSERFFIQENARLIDNYFLDIFGESNAGLLLNAKGLSYAIIALGGFGRSEQCVYSDVDVMFLFHEQVPEEAEELVREFIYPLWDAGLDVGHTTRTIDECISLMDTDLEILTALMDARFICGNPVLFKNLKDALDIAIEAGKTKYINRIRERCIERHSSFGDSSDLLEPNLKNGLGGLRDYHSMLWISKIRFGVNDFNELIKIGVFSENEFDSFQDALDFIWLVRNRLHMMAGRKCDQLYFEFQESIAADLQFKQKYGQRPVERFIGRLHSKMEFIKQHHLQFLAELGRKKQFFPDRNFFKRSRIPGLMVSRSMLNFTSDDEVLGNPGLLLKIFLESARLRLPLCSAARRTVTEYNYLAKEFTTSPEARKMFERIMHTVCDEFNVVNDMLSTGLLVSYIPEFDKIVNRIQYNQYHIYPVDRHSLHVLQAVRRFATKRGIEENPFLAHLYSDVANKTVLHWGALFHDIGKGTPEAEHSISGARLAREILRRKGLKEKHVRSVSFLIENHLFLINIAKRRDIEDEETAIFCARRIKEPDRLKMLYLLTVADSVSTGPNAWNTWTASLLRDLFLNVLEILESGEIVSTRKEKAIENRRKRIIDEVVPEMFSEEDVVQLIDRMSPRYLVNMSEKKIIQHLKMYKDAGRDGVVFKIRKMHRSANRKVIICGRQIAGCFSRLAGVFTLNGFDILNAQLYSWGNEIVLDVFTVRLLTVNEREEKRFAAVERDYQRVIKGELDLDALLAGKVMEQPTDKKIRLSGKQDRVSIDNNSSGFFTIIEVFTYDFQGLLYLITNTLYQNGIDIVYAKIGGHVDRIVDTFYIKTMHGCKIFDENLLRKLEIDILEAIKSVSPEYEAPDEND